MMYAARQDRARSWPRLDALAARLPARPVTRFAPSPTGYLHLGHVANAVCVWGLARALDGRVLLRIEDHDRGRCRPEYERALQEDLEWLGLEPDLPSPGELREEPSPYRQSDCGAIYEAELRRLASRATVFACDCTRKDLALERGDEPDVETRYGGRCRSRGLAEGEGRGLRLRIDPGEERFVDARLGERTQAPDLDCGDLLLRDRLGNWTYQFTVVVDDLRHGVDLIVRGEDLLSSTGRQLRLARLLGRREQPVFLHHPLIWREPGAKLSKAAGDTGVRELRARGSAPGEVLGRAAHAIGLVPQLCALRASDLPGLFERISAAHHGRMEKDERIS
jgi:glutamyl-tRNA synthetase/glutamyl-Q tRNA(Asp) synthetase